MCKVRTVASDKLRTPDTLVTPHEQPLTGHKQAPSYRPTTGSPKQSRIVAGRLVLNMWGLAEIELSGQSVSPIDTFTSYVPMPTT